MYNVGHTNLHKKCNKITMELKDLITDLWRLVYSVKINKLI
jgi:hypothetical protein